MELISSSCPEFAVYDSCPDKCGPRTCESINNKCEKLGCGPKQCSCREGFVQLTDNISDGCIPVDECLPAFPPTSTTPEPFEEGSGDSPGEPVELIKPRDSRADKCPLNSALKDCVPLIPLNCYTINTVSHNK